MEIPDGMTRTRRRGGQTIAAALLVLATAASASGGGTGRLTALKAGRIQTVTRGIIENGLILIRGGRIVGIRADQAVPGGARVLDFGRGYVMPGVVSPDSNLGLSGRASMTEDEASRFPAVLGKDLSGDHVVFSIDPAQADFALALRNGFTTLAVSPPAAGLSGQGALLTLGPPRLRDMILRRDAFLKMTVLVNTTFRRMLKTSLEAARTKIAAGQRAGRSPLKAGPREADDALVRVLEGEMPLIADCPGPNAVEYLLDAVAPYPRIRLAVRGGPGLYKAGPVLKEKRIPVILEPGIDESVPGLVPYPERKNYVLKCRGLGLEIAFQAPGPVQEQIRVFHSLNRLRGLGVDEETLIKGVTIVPARILGVESLVGSLEKGKRADLIVFRSDPLDGDPVIEAVLAGGEIVR